LIVKPRGVPLTMQKLQALLYRLPESHPSRHEIEQEYSRRKAGFKGELETDYFLSLLPEEDYLIFGSIRLPYGSNYFQIDTLLLSPRFAILVETKNLAGDLFFDPESNQLIKTVNGKEEVMSDPVLQVKRQKYQFKRWLSQILPNNLPLEHIVANSNHTAKLRTKPGAESIFKEVMVGGNLLFRISEMEATHKKQQLTPAQLDKLKERLLNEHQPLIQEILNQYSIQRQQIITGVRCPKCNHIAMIWIGGVWNCSKCDHCSKTAHLNTIKDYVLLYNTPFKNSQIREFLNIPSVHVTYRLLSKANLPSTGKKRHRTYHLELND
jgi:Nuclease-related domain